MLTRDFTNIHIHSGLTTDSGYSGVIADMLKNCKQDFERAFKHVKEFLVH